MNRIPIEFQLPLFRAIRVMFRGETLAALTGSYDKCSSLE